jgi:hypothetical protein
VRGEIAAPMRSFAPVPAGEHNRRTLALGDAVRRLRIALEDECGRGAVVLRTGEAPLFRQEDAAWFFRTLLEMGGWRGVFLPLARRHRVDAFHYPPDPALLRRIPARARVTITEPAIAALDMGPGGDGDSLQTLLDANFGSERQQVEVVRAESERDTDLAYLLDHQPSLRVRPGVKALMRDDNGGGGFEIRSRSRTVFVRAPDPFVFALNRGVPSEVLPSAEASTARVRVPPRELMCVPVLEGVPCETRRLAAIACHTGTFERGHYVLYLRLAGARLAADVDTWYYYNDVGDVLLQPVDIHDRAHRDETLGTSHADFIERHAYLFWARST